MEENKGSIIPVFGDLLQQSVCRKLVENASLIIHCAAGTSKSFAETVSNSAVTTRNLCYAVLESPYLQRFVNISSIAVYSNHDIAKRKFIDENNPIDKNCAKRYEAYSYGKYKQETVTAQFASESDLPLVNLRLGTVFGPGKKGLTSRVGIDSLGFYMHLGGRNKIPLVYIDNCAEAIIQCALSNKIENTSYNIIDDDLPTSRQLLKKYKREVENFTSIPISYKVFYLFSAMWEDYSQSSREQVPCAFNRRKCETYWKGSQYSNSKIKNHLGWTPKVKMKDALMLYLKYCSTGENKNA
jgi:nucleoside-diphosphate-sugar epimerase